MGRVGIWLLVLVMVAVACTSGSAGDAEVPGPGRLAVIDGDGNVAVMDPDGTNVSMLTDDARDRAVYTQPVWSPDSATLAWGEARPDGFAVAIRALDGDETVTVETSNLPFYMYWAPDSRRLGVLHNGSDGLDLEIVDVDSAAATVVDKGSPYYFTWTPASDAVITHVGSDRFEQVGVDGEKTRLGSTSAGYLAPQWTPRGLFHVDGGDLVLQSDDGSREPLVRADGLATFVANSQGTHVALQVLGEGGAVSVSLVQQVTVPNNVVVVVDVETGEIEVVEDRPALGFFWSPDGRSLLIFSTNEDRSAAVAKVWNVDGEVTEYASFIPPGAVSRDMLPFFPQYAQSHRLWSPGSSSFAFAGDIDGTRGIWVQELSADGPVRVSDGVWVSWSS